MSRLILSLLATSLFVHMRVSYHDDKKAYVGWGGCSAVWVAPHKILSAAHCFNQDVTDIWLKGPDGVSFKAKEIASDHEADLSLLETDHLSKHYARLGPSPSVGDKVEAVSCPGSLRFAYSEGKVASFQEIGPWGYRMIVGSSLVEHGFSGGPLFDRKGRLVGIGELVFSIPSAAGYITTDTIRKFLKENGL